MPNNDDTYARELHKTRQLPPYVGEKVAFCFLLAFCGWISELHRIMKSFSSPSLSHPRGEIRQRLRAGFLLARRGLNARE